MKWQCKVAPPRLSLLLLAMLTALGEPVTLLLQVPGVHVYDDLSFEVALAAFKERWAEEGRLTDEKAAWVFPSSAVEPFKIYT